ncbi:MAG TPA: MBL fold metallo-hydrolase [Magnetospirillaceae bacterium]|jgi:glyoxylase-like metal-dependent hydrolase (beta-lactamase superfamily II)
MSLDLPFPAAPEPGHTLTVAPGILWLRMPLPFALDHINLWLIEEGDAWAIVDTGLASNRSRELWDGVLTGPMGGRAPTRLLCTHFHPDHMGLAHWLTERFGLTMETTLGEWLMGLGFSQQPVDHFNVISLPFYKRAGFSDELITLASKRGNGYAQLTPQVPSRYTRIKGGEALALGGRRWEVIIGEGHSPELAQLWCAEAGLLISGDQVLPSISPNISVWPTEPEGDPLGLYLATLENLAHLPENTLVLPSHGLPFRGLHKRIDTMASHHEQRIELTVETCKEPITAADLIKVMFKRQLDDRTVFFALGEALAHLHHARTRGLVTRMLEDDGVHRWRRA